MHGQNRSSNPHADWIRGAEELERIILQVEGNPLQAGLTDGRENWATVIGGFCVFDGGRG